MLDDEDVDEEGDIAEESEDEISSLSAPVTPSKQAQNVMARASAHLRKKLKNSKQAARDSAEQQRVEKSVEIGPPTPLSQIRPSSANTRRLSPASSASDKNYKKNKYSMSSGDPDDEDDKAKRAALHDAVTLDYISCGPNMWDERLTESVDRHWREIFAPRPGEQLDEDLVSQVTTPLLSWHAENSANKRFGNFNRT